VQNAVDHADFLPIAARRPLVSTRVGHALSIERPVRHPLSSFVTALRRGWCHRAFLIFLAHISPATMITLAWRKAGHSLRHSCQNADQWTFPVSSVSAYVPHGLTVLRVQPPLVKSLATLRAFSAYDSVTNAILQRYTSGTVRNHGCTIRFPVAQQDVKHY